MFVERKVCYSALFTNLVGCHAGAVSFPLSDVILAQLACPLSKIMLCLHSGISNPSLYKHWPDAHPWREYPQISKKIDWSKYISWEKIHSKEQALVAGTKHSRQAWLPFWPGCLFGPAAFLACLVCSVPLLALTLQGQFLWQPLIVLTRQNKANGTCH